jgi:uncharacterized protein
VRGDLLRPPAVERARAALFAAREGRVRPGLDDKVLTEWNALFLATLAEAAAATAEPAWREAAVGIGEFLLRSLRRPDGRWLRSWQADGGARHLAYAADHAALVDAFTRLYELTGEARWVAEARTTADALLDLFEDRTGGGLFTTGHDAEALVARQKDVFDNATPSANSLAANGLLRLAALTGESRWQEAGETAVRAVGPTMGEHPSAFGELLGALERLVSPPVEIAVVGDPADPATGALMAEVRRRFLPRAVSVTALPATGAEVTPLLADRPLVDGKPTAYVCRHFACQRPVTDPAALAAQLDDVLRT